MSEKLYSLLALKGKSYEDDSCMQVHALLLLRAEKMSCLFSSTDIFVTIVKSCSWAFTERVSASSLVH